MATTCKLIAKNVLGSSAANVEFTSIPGTYTDLWLVFSARSDRGGSIRDEGCVQVNGDTGANYSGRTLRGNGSAATSNTSATTSWSRLEQPAASSTSSTFSSTSLYIPNYAGSTNKSASAESVQETNGSEAWIYAAAFLWSSTAAITSLKVFPEVGPNWVSGSSFYLYGITKA